MRLLMRIQNGCFFVRLEGRFSAPACMISPRRAERRSRLAGGHRRRRREAVWTAASTALRLIRSDVSPRHRCFRDALATATSAYEKLVSRPAKDLTAGRKSNAAMTPFCGVVPYLRHLFELRAYPLAWPNRQRGAPYERSMSMNAASADPPLSFQPRSMSSNLLMAPVFG